MKLTRFLKFSNYIQIVNGKLINKPLPIFKGNSKEKENNKERDKENERKNKKKISLGIVS